MWSDFLSLLVQVENSPSEFALYIVHESGGKCLPLPQIIKTKDCPLDSLTDHVPSLRAVLACMEGTRQLPSWPWD